MMLLELVIVGGAVAAGVCGLDCRSAKSVEFQIRRCFYVMPNESEEGSHQDGVGANKKRGSTCFFK